MLIVLDPLQLVDSSSSALSLDAAAGAALVAGQRGLVGLAYDGTNVQYVRCTTGGVLQADVVDRSGRLLGIVYGSQGFQLQQTPTNHNLQVELATGGTLYDGRQIRALTSSDVVTAAQGGAAALSGKWPVQQTDGTNVMPTMDAVTRRGYFTVTDGTNTMPTGDAAARALFFKTTDGTNTAAVKAASTAPSSTDPALVVAISPNSTITTTAGALPDLTATGTLGALNAVVSIATAGYGTTGFQLAAGTLIGTIVPEASMDGGTTWSSTYFDTTAGNKVPSIVFASSNAATAASIVGVGGSGITRVRVSAYTSGTANITLRAATIQDPSVLFSGVAGTTSPPTMATVGGLAASAAPSLTTATINPLSMTLAGALRVDGSAVTQPISGTATANQGTANTATNGWFVKVTDGTNTMPTGDAAARALFHKITDGTNTAAVKAGSTAAVATDPSQVVSLSPNNPIPAGTNIIGSVKTTDGTNTAAVKAASTAALTTDPALVVAISPNGSDVSTTGTLSSGASTLTLALAGYAGASFTMVSGTFAGTLSCSVSTDGGTTFTSAWFYQASSAKAFQTTTFLSSQTAGLSILCPPGTSHVRISVSAYTSGTGTVALRGAQTCFNPNMHESLTGNAPPAVAALVAGTDGSLLQALKTDTAGHLITASYESTKATYTSTMGINIANPATDFFTISGSSSKLVRVTRLFISMNTSSTAGAVNFNIIKRSSGNGGGTSTGGVAVPHDNTSPAATCNIVGYTVNPTGLGTQVGVIFGRKLLVTASTSIADNIEVIWGNRNDQGIILRGLADTLCCSLVSSGTGSANAYCTWEWTEE